MNNFEYISYINSCFRNNRLIRWPDNMMPLTIFIAPFRWYKARGEEYEYYEMIQNAMDIWEKASKNRIKFEPVANLYDSQINIEWKRVERQSLGHCYFSFDPKGRLYSAEVNIGLSDGLIHSAYQSKDEVFHTIIHEIGHALGLQHSPFKNDIMHIPHQYGVTSISKKDETTLKWLYSFPYGASKKEILSYYKVPENYDIDRLIYILETGVSPEEIQTEHNEQNNCVEDGEQLKYEQHTLEKLNKFNVSIQNITVSSDTEEYFKKLRIKKDFKDK